MAITRATNLAGLGTVFDALTDGGGLSISGVSTFTDLNVTRANVTGVSTFATLNITNSNPTQLNVTGVTTTTSLVSTAASITTGGLVVGIATVNNINSTHLNIAGLGTFSSGPVLIGTVSSTGTASQPLQVTGGAYVSGNLGIGTTNPDTNAKIHVIGGSGIYVGDDAVARLRNDGSFAYLESTYITGAGYKPLVLRTNDINRVTVDTNGNIGFGTVATTSIWGGNYQILSIGTKTSGPVIQFESTTANSNGKVLGAITAANLGSGVSTPESADLGFYQDGTSATQPGGSIRMFTRADGGGLSERVRLDNAGDFGIGDTNPAYKLSVVGTARLNGSSVQGTSISFGASPVTKTITIATSNVEAMLVFAAAFTSGGSNSAAALFTVGGFMGGSTQYAAATTTYTTTGSSMSISSITKASGSFSFTMTLSASKNSSGYVNVISAYPVTITVT